jgi:D-glycero-D-manno-heptose 1,7-bisphosphate phosphatase
MSASRRYVILDRDGTLIEERNYLSDPAGVVLLPRALEGLRAFGVMGFSLVVVTNQAGIGRGYFTEADLHRVNDRLRALLREGGVDWDGLYYCPHAPNAGCECRKPKPGMALQAARELGFDPRQAVVIGDKACDVELGDAIGAQTILVRTGYGAELAADSDELARLHPDAVVADLAEAAAWVRGDSCA